MDGLSDYVREHLDDPRDPHGVRHRLPSLVAIATLAIAAGCQGLHAIWEFAESLNHGQRRRLGCRRRPETRREFDVPCEKTFERMLKVIDADQLRKTYSEWMASRISRRCGSSTTG